MSGKNNNLKRYGMKNLCYRELKINHIEKSLFKDFNRFQEVKKCWRKEEGQWILKDIAFTEQWGSEEYEFLVKCL